MKTHSVAVIGTRGYPSYYGGFETAVRHIAPHLAGNGWDVTVYGRPGSTRPEDPSRDTKVRSVDTRGMETSSMSTLSYGLTSVLDAIRRKPDVALVMNVANGFWLPLLKAAGIPTVVNVDGIEWERAKWGRLAKRAFRLGAGMTAKYAGTTVADAVAIADRWRTDFGRDSLFIPYGGTEPGDLPIVPGFEHRKYILLVARFVPENSVGEFFEAVDVLAQDYPIAIVGSSGYSNHYDLTAQKLDRAHENVTWFGHVSDDNKLYSLWQHAGAYFHGHSVGGTNPALVQAMACGAPIVARNTVYNREVLSSVATYVEATPESIIQGLQTSMRNSATFDPRATLARARTSYSWEGVCTAYEQALLDAIDRREAVATERFGPI